EKQFLNVVAAVASSDDALIFGRSCIDRTCKPEISYVKILDNLKREGQALAQCFEPAYVRTNEYATELPVSLITEGDVVNRKNKYLEEVVHQLGHIYDFSNTVVEDTTDGKGKIKTKRLCTFFCCHCDCTWR
ncbi:MAG TPA: hypothetical protein VFF04_00870, partial [Candidatus Babeliales bacterium]|nr:hypothetical protein [Candidatus Babeliales bacterium]